MSTSALHKRESTQAVPLPAAATALLPVPRATVPVALTRRPQPRNRFAATPSPPLAAPELHRQVPAPPTGHGTQHCPSSSSSLLLRLVRRRRHRRCRAMRGRWDPGADDEPPPPHEPDPHHPPPPDPDHHPPGPGPPHHEPDGPDAPRPDGPRSAHVDVLGDHEMFFWMAIGLGLVAVVLAVSLSVCLCCPRHRRRTTRARRQWVHLGHTAPLLPVAVPQAAIRRHMIALDSDVALLPDRSVHEIPRRQQQQQQLPWQTAVCVVAGAHSSCACGEKQSPRGGTLQCSGDNARGHSLESVASAPTLAAMEQSNHCAAGETVRYGGAGFNGARLSVATAEAGCSICLERFDSGAPLSRLKCGHCYHPACIQQWFYQGPAKGQLGALSCPTCACEHASVRECGRACVLTRSTCWWRAGRAKVATGGYASSVVTRGTD
jgi:hypothetical protein